MVHINHVFNKSDIMSLFFFVFTHDLFISHQQQVQINSSSLEKVGWEEFHFHFNYIKM